MDNTFNPLESRKPMRSQKILEIEKKRKEWETTQFIPELEPYFNNGMLVIVRPKIWRESSLKVKPLTEEEKKIISDLEKRAEEAKTRMTPFVEKGFGDGTLVMNSDHIHLKYDDEKYWGHYTCPTKDGVDVTVYFKENIVGDRMDIEGERGPSIQVGIPLNLELRKKIFEQMEKALDEGNLDSFPDSRNAMIDELKEVESGLN